jgi:hypothetical protein
VKDNHFDKTFYYIVGCTTIGLAYVFMITFIPIPVGNVRFADTALGFFLGTLITSCLYYLTGGNPTQTKKGSETGTGATTAEFTASVTTEPIEKPDSQTE